MKRMYLLAAALLAAACANSDISAPRRDALLSLDPSFVRFDTDAYAAAEKSASFWAVGGEEREIRLHYLDTGEEFLRFKVPEEALPAGDSVQISIRVATDGTMRFHFEPSGLQFSSDHPAELHIEFDRAQIGLLQSLTASIWRQDIPLAPWIKLPTLHLSGDDVESDVLHFTDFGMAVN